MQPYIEKALDLLEESGTYATLRYHPMCYLKEKYWKYVVNARFVLYDPWEWEYGHLDKSDDAYWQAAVGMGEQVANECEGCDIRQHCGGWNKTYAEGVGVELPVIKTDKYKERGELHMMNPVNNLKGWI
jgi:hypothetical protein